MSLHPTQRFTDRAKDYAAFRPGYPRAVFDLLLTKCPLPATAADIAAGTGIFSRGLATTGYRTIAVEPNAAMRAEAEGGPYEIIDGTGESTGLAAQSVDLITVAQAFHWLDRTAAHAEFHRILKPGGTIAIVWNSRVTEGNPFMADMLTMMQNLPGYNDSNHPRGKVLEDAVAAFCGPAAERHVFANPHELDFNSLIGRLLSASYVPKPGQAGHDETMAGARELYERHQVGGKLPYGLETIVYVNRTG